MSKQLSDKKRKTIEEEIEHIHLYKREIALIREEIIHGGLVATYDSIGGGKSNLPGKSTENKVVKLDMHQRLRYLEDHIKAIEYVLDRLNEGKKNLVALRYFSKQKYDWDEIAIHLHCDRVTAIRWRNEIVLAIAKRLGMVET